MNHGRAGLCQEIPFPVLQMDRMSADRPRTKDPVFRQARHDSLAEPQRWLLDRLAPRHSECGSPPAYLSRHIGTLAQGVLLQSKRSVQSEESLQPVVVCLPAFLKKAQIFPNALPGDARPSRSETS